MKSGKAYKSHKALTNYMEIPDYHLERTYVFSTFNVEKDGEIIYLLFAAKKDSLLTCLKFENNMNTQPVSNLRTIETNRLVEGLMNG